MRLALRGVPDPTKTGCNSAAINAAQENGGNHDLRNARLSLYSGPAAGAAEALRYHHAKTLGEARHQAGRIFYDDGRRIPSRADLFPGLGIARRAREEVGDISG